MVTKRLTLRAILGDRMRTVHLLVAVGLMLSLSVLSLAQSSSGGPVVVELFTSEGCSSCPPADRALAQMEEQHSANGVPLIVLGEHVDYWDGKGWNDRFSQHVLTARQTEYAHGAEIFTPQLVVDGRADQTPSDSASLQREIAEGAAKPKPASVTLGWVGKDQLKVTVEHGPSADVLLFVTEDGLSTVVKGGENRGVTLQHTAVVREMRRLGKTAKDGAFQQTVELKPKPDWQTKSLHYIVLVQEKHGAGPIVGAAELQPATLAASNTPPMTQ